MIKKIATSQIPHMRINTKHHAVVSSTFMLALAFLASCSNGDGISKKSFIGKWQSSRMETPLYLHENSDWEIKKDDGTIVQYGIWEYKDKKIIWSYKVDSRIGHDVNHVLTVTPGKFQLLESDQTLTSFNRLD